MSNRFSSLIPGLTSIVSFLMPLSLLDALPRAHIRLVAGHPMGFAFLIPYRNSPGEHPPVIPVLMEHTVLVFKMWSKSFDVSADLPLHLLHIRGMNAVEPFVDPVSDLLFAKAHRSPFQRVEKWASFVMRFESHSPSLAARDASA